MFDKQTPDGVLRSALVPSALIDLSKEDKSGFEAYFGYCDINTKRVITKSYQEKRNFSCTNLIKVRHPLSITRIAPVRRESEEMKIGVESGPREVDEVREMGYGEQSCI